jgi:NhaP-type Na+/H+ or K+/H+ antiporter
MRRAGRGWITVWINEAKKLRRKSLGLVAELGLAGNLTVAAAGIGVAGAIAVVIVAYRRRQGLCGR